MYSGNRRLPVKDLPKLFGNKVNSMQYNLKYKAMKKISLKSLNLKEVEQLSREQLKNVMGGWTGGSDQTGETGEETVPEAPKCNCNNPRDCPDPGQVCGAWCEGGWGAGRCS